MSTKPTLETLPPELLTEILLYLESTPFYIPCPRAPIPPPHPLLALSETTRTLHAAVESLSHHLLIKHRFRLAKSPKQRQPYRKLYLSPRLHRCIFCNKKTAAVAVVFNHLRCCRACDRREWPDKLTFTQARREWRLTEEQLVTLPHGEYVCMGVITRMWLGEDVRRLAESLGTVTTVRRRPCTKVGPAGWETVA